LAAGHVDIVVDYDLKPFDYLPLVGLIEAAGGIITDWDGHTLDYGSDGRVISVATPELHAEMISLLQRERKQVFAFDISNEAIQSRQNEP